MSTNETTSKRRFSLEEDFMNYTIDDLLYGALQHLATYSSDNNLLYLTKAKMTKSRKALYSLCDLNARSLKAHIEKLKSKGLISEEKVNCDNTIVEAYIFPYKYDSKYQMVNWEMLWYVVSTRNKSAIQIYVYLLNKFLWKQKSDEYYIFTNKELQIVLGYSPNTNLADSIISNVLESLAREGVIKFEQFYETHVDEVTGKEFPSPKKKLLFVAQEKKELRKI